MKSYYSVVDVNNILLINEIIKELNKLDKLSTEEEYSIRKEFDEKMKSNFKRKLSYLIVSMLFAIILFLSISHHNIYMVTFTTVLMLIYFTKIYFETEMNKIDSLMIIDDNKEKWNLYRKNYINKKKQSKLKNIGIELDINDNNIKLIRSNKKFHYTKDQFNNINEYIKQLKESDIKCDMN